MIPDSNFQHNKIVPHGDDIHHTKEGALQHRPYDQKQETSNGLR